jgi:cobalamin synthase
MTANAIATVAPSHSARSSDSGKLLLGTGLAFASLILVPALATQIGLGASLTGALRIALMRASSRAIGGSSGDGEGATTSFSCH